MAADYIADSVRSNEEIFVPIFTVSHVGFTMQTYLTHGGLTRAALDSTFFGIRLKSRLVISCESADDSYEISK